MTSTVRKRPLPIVLISVEVLRVRIAGSVGSWSIGFGMADEKHQGQYQGVFSLSWGLGGTFGPAFVTAMAIGIGQMGWLYMGVMFAITGMVMHRLVVGRPTS